jgi:hypothetical protein
MKESRPEKKVEGATQKREEDLGRCTENSEK